MSTQIIESCESGVEPYNARAHFRITYRDQREKAKIACQWCDQLVAIRGFGPLLNVYKRKTHIGRIRVNDLRVFDNSAVADRCSVTDYNPSRFLGEIKVKISGA